MTTTTQAAPVRPAPLSLYRINSPAEIRAWKDAEAGYFAALRGIEQAKQDAVEMAKAEADRPMSEQEYYIMACQRDNENKAKAAARAAAQKEADQAHAAYLASRPATVEIMRGEPFNFFLEFAHWSRAGYELHGDNLHSTGFGMWHATLTAPAAKGGK